MSNIQIPWERWQQSGRLGARAELHDVRLFTLSTDLRDFVAEPPYVVDLVVESSLQRGEGANHMVVSAEYALKALSFGPDQNPDDEGVQPEVVAAEVNFTLIALYSLRESDGETVEATTDELEAFAESTGLMTLHPYARELIQDQTARLGLPSLTIGVARIAQLDAKESKT